jgi:hypothetical protein
MENMNRIYNKLRDNPGILVKIITECDDICKTCPHNIENKCKKEKNSFQEIKEMDESILLKAGLKSEVILPAKSIFEKINNSLNNPHDIKEICGDCSWQKRCKFYQQPGGAVVEKSGR